jgi:hypothetical protein
MEDEAGPCGSYCFSLSPRLIAMIRVFLIGTREKKKKGD